MVLFNYQIHTMKPQDQIIVSFLEWDISDFMETLSDLWMLSAKGKKNESEIWRIYDQWNSKPMTKHQSRVYDLEKSWSIISQESKDYLTSKLWISKFPIMTENFIRSKVI